MATAPAPSALNRDLDVFDGIELNPERAFIGSSCTADGDGATGQRFYGNEKGRPA